MNGIALEVMPDAGAPQVGITIDGLDGASTSVVTVDVSWDSGESWHGVLGASEIEVVGATFLRDHVPALNIASLYRLTVVSGVTTPATLTASISVPSSTAWLQDPRAPHSAVAIAGARTSGAVLILSPSAGRMVRAQAMDLMPVAGSSEVVASVGSRQQPSGLPMLLRAIPAEQGALVKALRALFDQAGQVVIRGLSADIPIDPVAHVVPGDISEVPVVGGRLGFRNDWEFTITQTRPVSLRLAIPWWTYDQVKALWSGYSYADVLAARPGDTYLDWLKSPEVP